MARETERGGCVRCLRCRQRNSRFANALRHEHALWRDAGIVDRTGVFPDASQLLSGILIREPGAQPVVIEAGFDPASSAECDARNRLGLGPASASDPIEQVIAALLPESVRWAVGGWLTGGIDDIVRSIEHAMVPGA